MYSLRESFLFKKTAKYFAITLIISTFAPQRCAHLCFHEAHPYGVTSWSGTQPARRVGWVQHKYGNRATSRVARLIKAFSNVTVCTVKLRKFAQVTAVMQRRASALMCLYTWTRPYNIFFVVGVCAMMYITHGVGWLALLILDLGAMRRPDCRDKRGGNTPTLFLFPQNTY
jgi:hypothetical protein